MSVSRLGLRSTPPENRPQAIASNFVRAGHVLVWLAGHLFGVNSLTSSGVASSGRDRGALGSAFRQNFDDASPSIRYPPTRWCIHPAITSRLGTERVSPARTVRVTGTARSATALVFFPAALNTVLRNFGTFAFLIARLRMRPMNLACSGESGHLSARWRGRGNTAAPRGA